MSLDQLLQQGTGGPKNEHQPEMSAQSKADGAMLDEEHHAPLLEAETVSQLKAMANESKAALQTHTKSVAEWVSAHRKACTQTALVLVLIVGGGEAGKALYHHVGRAPTVVVPKVAQPLAAPSALSLKDQTPTVPTVAIEATPRAGAVDLPSLPLPGPKEAKPSMRAGQTPPARSMPSPPHPQVSTVGSVNARYPRQTSEGHQATGGVNALYGSEAMAKQAQSMDAWAKQLNQQP